LFEPMTPESLIATGYYCLGQWDSGVADRLLQRYDVLDGVLSTTSQAFLGMSIGCARCHDHKKDPATSTRSITSRISIHSMAEPLMSVPSVEAVAATRGESSVPSGASASTGSAVSG
jgi:hypothetical protein